MTKFVTVIKGRGIDYVVDLRKTSASYLKWEAVELTDDNALAVFIPAGIGHAFLSLEDHTIQVYSVDKRGKNDYSKLLNHTEGQIGLKLPIPIAEISDYDSEAPFLHR